MKKDNLEVSMLMDMHLAWLFTHDGFERASDTEVGRVVKHLQAMYLGLQNGYQPGGPKHVPSTWQNLAFQRRMLALRKPFARR